jgi:hypothetical protein
VLLAWPFAPEQLKNSATSEQPPRGAPPNFKKTFENNHKPKSLARNIN